MAAAVMVPAKPLDLKSAGTHSVQIGDSFRKATPARGLTAIRYNHKPAVTEDETHSAWIVQKKDRASLSLQDGEDKYIYEGKTAESDNTLVLVPDDSGEGYKIERLDTALLYNLIQAPWEHNRHKLAEQYTTLSASDNNGALASGDAAAAEDDDDLEPDTSNPFDWRNYFTAPSPNTSQLTRPKPAAHSPALSQTQPIQRTPASRPAKKPTNPMLSNQRKPQSATRPKASTTAAPASKRRKSSPEPAPRSVPEVRVSASASATKKKAQPRKVLVDDINLDPDGDLAMSTDDGRGAGGDGEDDLLLDDASLARPAAAAQRHNKHAGRGGLGPNNGLAGPISLRSAASSPGSRSGSPALGSTRFGAGPGALSRSRPAATDEDLIMDDGDGDGAVMVGVDGDEDEDAEGEVEDGVEENGDVEDLVLPSPVREKSGGHGGGAAREQHPSLGSGRRRSSAAAVAGSGGMVVDGDGDDDDELEAGLMEAMMEDDEDIGAPAVVVQPAEEEEESEEE